jgi:hypothetical protein
MLNSVSVGQDLLENKEIKMEIIYESMRSGKTTKLLNAFMKDGNGIFLAFNHIYAVKVCQMINNFSDDVYSKELKELKCKRVMYWEDYLRGSLSRNNLYIDVGEFILEDLFCRGHVKMIAFTKEENDKRNNESQDGESFFGSPFFT